MSPNRCPFCGKENPATCLECRHCGRHLPPRTEGVKSRGIRPATCLRLLIFFAVVAALVLVLLTPEVPGVVDAASKTDNFYRDLVAMEHAIRLERPHAWTVSEGAANAYLDAVVEHHRQSDAPNWRSLVLARVDFRDQSALLTLHHQRGPLVLSQQLELLPGKTGAGWTLLSLKLGKLPVPPILRDWAAGAVLQAFSAFERDLFVLRRVSEVHLDNEKAYLVNRGKTV